MGYRIFVDPEICIGNSPCVQIASNTFALDTNKRAVVINPHGDDDPIILEAAQACPVEAIYLFDEETGEQVWPALG